MEAAAFAGMSAAAIDASSFAFLEATFGSFFVLAARFLDGETSSASDMATGSFVGAGATLQTTGWRTASERYCKRANATEQMRWYASD